MPILSWARRQVLDYAQALTDRVVTEYAFLVEGQAKINVRENGQIDTGFMMNSIYTVSPGVYTYRRAWPTGVYISRRTGRAARRIMPTPMAAPPHRALVAVGAEYGLQQEIRNSFLYRALYMVGANAPDVSIIRGDAGE